jgi:hypothetical protein
MSRIIKQPPIEKLLEFYDAWLRHGTTHKVAMALKKNWLDIDKWVKQWPDYAAAKDRANRLRSKQTFANYVLGKLSKESQDVWSEIQFWRDSEKRGEKVEEILADRPVRLRQELFIHALLHGNYNISNACVAVGVSRTQMEHWRDEDPDFRKLLEEVHMHKKDFFEGMLVHSVRDMEISSILFVNRTLNADRGYSEKFTVKHELGDSGGVDIDALELDVDTRRKLLAAIRAKEQKENVLALPAPADKEAIDV